MRHQKMMTWVAISGTALSIFLVMAFFMTEEAKTVAMSPESNRPRIYIGENFHMREAGKYNDSSSPVSYEFAQKFYSDLDGVERISFINAWQDNCDVNVKGERWFPLSTPLLMMSFGTSMISLSLTVVRLKMPSINPRPKSDTDARTRPQALWRG